jgi:hypothetical protein
MSRTFVHCQHLTAKGKPRVASLCPVCKGGQVYCQHLTVGGTPRVAARCPLCRAARLEAATPAPPAPAPPAPVEPAPAPELQVAIQEAPQQGVAVGQPANGMERLRREFEEQIPSVCFRIGRRKGTAAKLQIVECPDGMYRGFLSVYARNIRNDLRKRVAAAIANLGYSIGIGPHQYAGTVFLEAYTPEARREVAQKWQWVQEKALAMHRPKEMVELEPITNRSTASTIL